MIITYRVTLTMKWSEKLVFECDSARTMENVVWMLKRAQYTDRDGEREKEILVEPVFHEIEPDVDDNGEDSI